MVPETTKTPYDAGIKAYADGYDVDPGITRDLELMQKGYLRAIAGGKAEREAVDKLLRAADWVVRKDDGLNDNVKALGDALDALRGIRGVD